jgi:hypothetical protein
MFLFPGATLHRENGPLTHLGSNIPRNGRLKKMAVGKWFRTAI